MSGSSCALVAANYTPLTYLMYDVIHTCTFYEFLRIQWADVLGNFARKCAPKRDFQRPIIKSLPACWVGGQVVKDRGSVTMVGLGDGQAVFVSEMHVKTVAVCLARLRGGAIIF